MSACKVEPRQREDYGDIQSSSEGVKMSNIEEHRGGWQRNECLVCHNVSLNVHRDIDYETINDNVRKNEGSKYCLTCHGNNGN